MSDSDSDVILSKRISKLPSIKFSDIKNETFDSEFPKEQLNGKKGTSRTRKTDNLRKTKKTTKKTAKRTTKKTTNKTTKKTSNTNKKKDKPVLSRQKKKEAIRSTKNDSDLDEIPNDVRKQFREGQKFITPPNGDATRAFYESLYEENPYSIIALKYCVENGVLLGAKHAIAFERLEFLREGGYLKRSLGGIQKEAVEYLKSFDNKKGGFSEG